MKCQCYTWGSDELQAIGDLRLATSSGVRITSHGKYLAELIELDNSRAPMIVSGFSTIIEIHTVVL